MSAFIRNIFHWKSFSIFNTLWSKGSFFFIDIISMGLPLKKKTTIERHSICDKWNIFFIVPFAYLLFIINYDENVRRTAIIFGIIQPNHVKEKKNDFSLGKTPPAPVSPVENTSIIWLFSLFIIIGSSSSIHKVEWTLVESIDENAFFMSKQIWISNFHSWFWIENN